MNTADWLNKGWFITSSGKRFYPMNPRPEDVCIEDIAHALSNICRFGGHVKTFYSVAQHSLLVEKIEPGLPSLMHDATEAYCGDMVRPIKLSMPAFVDMEHGIWRAICERLQIPQQLPASVKLADNRALFTERRDLITGYKADWEDEGLYPTHPDRITPMRPIFAELAFLERFYELLP